MHSQHAPLVVRCRCVGGSAVGSVLGAAWEIIFVVPEVGTCAADAVVSFPAD